MYSSIRGVWREFTRHRLGLAGLILLSAFILVALLAPLIAPNHPIKDTFLAESYAYPEWFRAFPRYQNLPPNFEVKVKPIFSEEGWTILTAEGVSLPAGGNAFIRLEAHPGKRSTVQLSHDFQYRYDPPQTLTVEGGFLVPELQGGLLNISIYLVNPSGFAYRLETVGLNAPAGEVGFSFSSKALTAEEKAAMGLKWFENAASYMMGRQGVYRLAFHFDFNPLDGRGGYASVALRSFRVYVPGLAFGFLGTDHIGSDLFSQLVYGSRISLLIGVSASLIATTLGVLVGVVAGYVGSKLDEGLMRLVDVLLVLPFLPLLMVISGVFGKSVWNLILLLGVLSWPGFARVVRAKTLQLKETTFVEASKAMGSSPIHVIFTHIVPNVVPYMYAVIALSIPGFVVTEAALSFLALGDPAIPSWGRMFYTANAFGAFRILAWWWIIPPGVAITLLSLSFVFVGHALDEVMNPRLRARR
ncbi:MAG: ABC transporter permease [Candidatus Bathyarchaeia archaeon]